MVKKHWPQVEKKRRHGWDWSALRAETHGEPLYSHSSLSVSALCDYYLDGQHRSLELLSQFLPCCIHCTAAWQPWWHTDVQCGRRSEKGELWGKRHILDTILGKVSKCSTSTNGELVYNAVLPLVVCHPIAPVEEYEEHSHEITAL